MDRTTSRPESDTSPAPATAAAQLADELVGAAAAGRGRWHRIKTGAGLLRTMLRNLRLQPDAKHLPYDGFAPRLVAGGQRGEVVRHMRTHAGCILLGPPGWLASAALDLIDQIQARKGRAESLAECHANITGREVGWILREVADGTVANDHARKAVLDLLAGENRNGSPPTLGRSEPTRL